MNLEWNCGFLLLGCPSVSGLEGKLRALYEGAEFFNALTCKGPFERPEEYRSRMEVIFPGVDLDSDEHEVNLVWHMLYLVEHVREDLFLLFPETGLHPASIRRFMKIAYEIWDERTDVSDEKNVVIVTRSPVVIGFDVWDYRPNLFMWKDDDIYYWDNQDQKIKHLPEEHSPAWLAQIDVGTLFDRSQFGGF